MNLFENFFNQLFAPMMPTQPTQQAPTAAMQLVATGDNGKEWLERAFPSQTPEWAPWHPEFDWTPQADREAKYQARMQAMFAPPTATPSMPFADTPERASQRTLEVPGVEVVEGRELPAGVAPGPAAGDAPTLMTPPLDPVDGSVFDKPATVDPRLQSATVPQAPAPASAPEVRSETSSTSWTADTERSQEPIRQMTPPPMRLGAMSFDTDSVSAAVRDAVGPRIPMTANSNADARTSAAQQIVNHEARRDRQGRVAVYGLPANDGGGSYEVAGINQKYHPQAARKLAELIKAGKHAEAEAYAVEYIAKYTDGPAKPFENPGVNYSIRDITFNRGPGGANGIIRMALGQNPASRSVAHRPLSADDLAKAVKMSQENPADFVQRLTDARMRYEYKFVGVRPNLDRGLRNRWAGVNKIALERTKLAAPTAVAEQADPEENKSPWAWVFGQT